MIDPAGLRSLFDQAVDLPAAERAAFLDQACRGNAVLRREVERLLTADERLGPVFDTGQAPASTDPPARAPKQWLAPGTRLGPYSIAAVLGAGGMGDVYKAHDSRLDRTVAIKVLPRELAADPVARQRLEREARAAAALAHPHICTVLDIGRQDDVDYLVMEYLEGETLASRLRHGKLPLDQALTYGIQIADALAAAHRAGIVHRDLKPGNIILIQTGAKLLDFGLAKRRQPPVTEHATALHEPPLTRTGVVLGTLQYMAPEQLEGREADERTDVFAFGVILYEMLTGRRAFEGTTDAAVIGHILHANPPPPSSIEPTTPPGLDRLVQLCLAKDPSARCQSVADIHSRLISARDRGYPPADTGANELTRHTQSRTQRSIAAIKRHAAASAVVALVLAAVISLATSVWLRRSKPVATVEPERPLIAVRAFRYLSSDRSQSYFAPGLKEELHDKLSQLSGIRLLSGNTTDVYSDGEIRRMASELGVSGVIDGSVRLDGNRIRLAVELIDPSTQQTRWSKRYDRDLVDVFAVQNDVVQHVARALQANLTPGERERLEKRPTGHIGAYLLYLKALNTWKWGERAEELAAIGLLRQAIELDPAFALARGTLAFFLINVGGYSDDLRTSLAEGIAEAEATLRQDPSSSGAHFTLATAYFHKGFTSQARLSFQRALALDPNNISSMYNLSILEVYFGRFAEALQWARRGFTLSGKGANSFYHLAVPLLSLRDDNLTWRLLTDGERRFPDFSRLQVMLATLEVLRGRDAEAAGRLKRAVERAPDNGDTKSMAAEVAFLTDSRELESLTEPLLGTAAGISGWWVAETPRVRYAYALARRGDSARAAAFVTEAERWARRKVEDGDETPVWRVELAAIHALKKDHASALDALDRAYDAGYREYGLLERDPIFAPFRRDNRFVTLLDRMRQDVTVQRQIAQERGLLDVDALLAPQK